MEPKFRTAWNSYVINNHDEDNLKNYIKDTSAEISDGSPRVTFLCGSEEVSVSSTLAGVAFPALRDVLKSFQSGQCSCDLLFRNEATIFISLDTDIDINMLWMLKQIVTMSLSEVKMSSFQLGQLRDLMGMLGMSMNLLKFEELASADHREDLKDEVMHTSVPKYEEVLEIDISSPPETEGRHLTLDEVTEAEVEGRKSEEAEMDHSDMINPNSEEVDKVFNDCVTLQQEIDVTSSEVKEFSKDDEKNDDTNIPLPLKDDPVSTPEDHGTDQQDPQPFFMQPKDPEETKQSISSSKSNYMENHQETSPLKPKRSGKRKTIDDAIENIAAVAKKKAKEEVYASIPATIVEEKPSPFQIGSIDAEELVSSKSPDLLDIHSNDTNEEHEEEGVSPNGKTFEITSEGLGLSKIKPTKSDNTSKTSKCPEQTCKNSMVSFKNKTELLNHVAVAHYNVTLLEAYPFRRNKECSLCISNEAKKIFSAKTKAAWMAHIVTHEEILDVLPDTITEAVKLLPKRARNQNKTARKDQKKDVQEEIRNLDETEPIPDQFSDGPLATSYVEPSFDFEKYEKTLASAPVAEVTVANRSPGTVTPEKSSCEGEDSRSPLSSPFHALTPAASTEMRRMSLHKMDSVPASIEELPRPLAQSSVALASLPSQPESFPPPLAQSSTVDTLTGLICKLQILQYNP